MQELSIMHGKELTRTFWQLNKETSLGGSKRVEGLDPLDAALTVPLHLGSKWG